MEWPSGLQTGRREGWVGNSLNPVRGSIIDFFSLAYTMGLEGRKDIKGV